MFRSNGMRYCGSGCVPAPVSSLIYIKRRGVSRCQRGDVCASYEERPSKQLVLDTSVVGCAMAVTRKPSKQRSAGGRRSRAYAPGLWPMARGLISSYPMRLYLPCASLWCYQSWPPVRCATDRARLSNSSLEGGVPAVFSHSPLSVGLLQVSVNCRTPIGVC